jgi:hypothetical protein
VIEVTALVVVLIRETVVPAEFVTHTLDPSGLTATLEGLEPTVIEVTALVAVLIRETVVPPEFVTHTLDPSGLTATPEGSELIVIEVTAVVEGVIALAGPGNVITLAIANAVARTRVLRKNRVLGK